MNIEYLRQADIILSKCGRQLLPGGLVALPIPKAFTMPMVLQPGASTTFTKQITGEAPWILLGIASDQTASILTGVRIQIQLPNGRFLFGGNGVDIGQFCWIGSWAWLQDPGLRCKPGDKFNVTLSDPGQVLTNPQPVNLKLDGAYLYYIKGGAPSTDYKGLAHQLPRYYGIVNENILAPAWYSNQGIVTPQGYEDEYFVYSTPEPLDVPSQTTWTLSGGAIVTPPNPLPFQVTIDAGYEMFIRRMLFDLQVTSTAAGIVVGKIRNGAGYSLMDNNIDLQRFLGGTEYPGFWRVKGTDSIYIDAQIADFSGTGTLTFQAHFEGFRRRRKA